MDDDSAEQTRSQKTEHDSSLNKVASVTEWVLLDGSRLVVALCLLVVVAVALVVVGTIGPDALRRAFYTGDSVDWLFQSLLGAIITGVTLVVTINQLVLAQELGAAGDQRQRMAEAMAFREDVEPYLDRTVSPAKPAQFFRSLLSGLEQECTELSAILSTGIDQSARDEVTTFAEELSDEIERLDSLLETSGFGSFDLMGPLLGFEYAGRINDSRQLRARHEEALPPAALERLETIRESLEFFGAAREHVKTLYFQWELIELSRRMLYVSIPALLIAVSTLLFVENPGQIQGATVGIEHGLLFISVATAGTLTPFVLLVSYVLRIATVTRRTLAIGPFVLRGSEED